VTATSNGPVFPGETATTFAAVDDTTASAEARTVPGSPSAASAKNAISTSASHPATPQANDRDSAPGSCAADSPARIRDPVARPLARRRGDRGGRACVTRRAQEEDGAEADRRERGEREQRRPRPGREGRREREQRQERHERGRADDVVERGGREERGRREPRAAGEDRGAEDVARARREDDAGREPARHGGERVAEAEARAGRLDHGRPPLRVRREREDVCGAGEQDQRRIRAGEHPQHAREVHVARGEDGERDDDGEAEEAERAPATASLPRRRERVEPVPDRHAAPRAPALENASTVTNV
jgi:ribonuclease E